MGFGSQVEVDKCLERVKVAQAAAVRVWEQENAILQRFEDECRPEPVDTPLLTPMNPDEYIEGRSVVDQENKTRRPL